MDICMPLVHLYTLPYIYTPPCTSVHPNMSMPLYICTPPYVYMPPVHLYAAIHLYIPLYICTSPIHRSSAHFYFFSIIEHSLIYSLKLTSELESRQKVNLKMKSDNVTGVKSSGLLKVVCSGNRCLTKRFRYCSVTGGQ